MTVSINNNQSAILALQSLNQSMSDAQDANNRVSTGRRIDKPSDNAAVWGLAQRLRSDQSSLQSVTDSLNRAVSIIGVANTAGATVSDLLNQLKSKAVSATDPSLDATARTAYNNDFKALLQQLTQAVSSAVFSGSNLIDGSIAVPGLKFISDATNTSFITITPQPMALGSTNVTLTAGADILTVTRASAFLTMINSSINNVTMALGKLGSQTTALNLRVAYIGRLSDSLAQGVSNLVDADIAKESSALQALQVKQQLGAQSLSIANSRPQVILSLFK